MTRRSHLAQRLSGILIATALGVAAVTSAGDAHRPRPAPPVFTPDPRITELTDVVVPVGAELTETAITDRPGAVTAILYRVPDTAWHDFALHPETLRVPLVGELTEIRALDVASRDPQTNAVHIGRLPIGRYAIVFRGPDTILIQAVDATSFQMFGEVDGDAGTFVAVDRSNGRMRSDVRFTPGEGRLRLDATGAGGMRYHGAGVIEASAPDGSRAFVQTPAFDARADRRAAIVTDRHAYSPGDTVRYVEVRRLGDGAATMPRAFAAPTLRESFGRIDHLAAPEPLDDDVAAGAFVLRHGLRSEVDRIGTTDDATTPIVVVATTPPVTLSLRTAAGPIAAAGAPAVVEALVTDGSGKPVPRADVSFDSRYQNPEIEDLFSDFAARNSWMRVSAETDSHGVASVKIPLDTNALTRTYEVEVRVFRYDLQEKIAFTVGDGRFALASLAAGVVDSSADAPVARVIGRAVVADGRPAAGLPLRILYDDSAPTGPAARETLVKTASDGVFSADFPVSPGRRYGGGTVWVETPDTLLGSTGLRNPIFLGHVVGLACQRGLEEPGTAAIDVRSLVDGSAIALLGEPPSITPFEITRGVAHLTLHTSFHQPVQPLTIVSHDERYGGESSFHTDLVFDGGEALRIRQAPRPRSSISLDIRDRDERPVAASVTLDIVSPEDDANLGPFHVLADLGGESAPHGFGPFTGIHDVADDPDFQTALYPAPVASSGTASDTGFNDEIADEATPSPDSGRFVTRETRDGRVSFRLPAAPGVSVLRLLAVASDGRIGTLRLRMDAHGTFVPIASPTAPPVAIACDGSTYP